MINFCATEAAEHTNKNKNETLKIHPQCDTENQAVPGFSAVRVSCRGNPHSHHFHPCGVLCCTDMLWLPRSFPAVFLVQTELDACHGATAMADLSPSYHVSYSIGFDHFKTMFSPGQCGSVDWALACEPKGRWFNSWSGHMPALQVRSPVGARARDNHTLMFLSLSSPTPLSKNK